MDSARSKAGKYAFEQSTLAEPASRGRRHDFARIEPAGKDAMRDQEGAQVAANTGIEASHKVRRTVREQILICPGICLQRRFPAMSTQVGQNRQAMRRFLQPACPRRRNNYAITQTGEGGGDVERGRQIWIVENYALEVAAIGIQQMLQNVIASDRHASLSKRGINLVQPELVIVAHDAIQLCRATIDQASQR